MIRVDAVNDRVMVEDELSHIPRYLVPFRGKHGFDRVGAFAVVWVLCDFLADESRCDGERWWLADACDIVFVLERLEFGRPRIDELATATGTATTKQTSKRTQSCSQNPL